MRSRRILNSNLFAVVGILGVLIALAGEVWAVVGRPATPVSAAGAARRSVRRP